MKRRELVKTTLFGSSMLSIKAWVPPTVVAVSLPAHATTSGSVYSGLGNSPSAYTILRDWMGVAMEMADGSYSVSVQNTDNTVRIGYLIAADEIGIAEPAGIVTSCTDIDSSADGSITAISESEILLAITIRVQGTIETIAITLPLSASSISFPPLAPSCTLS